MKKIFVYSVVSLILAQSSYGANINLGDNSSVEGTYSTAVGERASVKGDSSTAIGSLAKVEGSNSLGMGANSSVTGHSSSAIGPNSKVEGDSSVAVGSNSSVTGEVSIALGVQSNVKGNGSVAIGASSSTTKDGGIAIGDYANSSGQNSIALGSQTKVTGSNSVALGNNSVASENNVVSVGDIGNERRITNVAPGIKDTDAVNVSQLNEKADITYVNEIENKVEQNTADIANISSTANNFGNRIGNIENKVNYLENKMNKGFSLMAAMNAIDFGEAQEGDLLIGAGIGHYENSQGVAIGVAYIPSKDTHVTAKYSVSTDDVHTSAIGVGVTHRIYNFK